jgi:glyoxylase-like metal-dependent hydrolase (beta-lactamase superfamily II)
MTRHSMWRRAAWKSAAWRAVALASVCTSFAVVVAAQAPAGRGQGAGPPGPQRSITQVTGDLYMAKNNNHNTVFYVTPQGIILADPINTEFSQWLKGQLGERYPGRPVRYVLHSHHDFDHASGGEVWNDTAEIVAHENFSAELRKASATLPGILRRLDQNRDNKIQQAEMGGGPLAGFFAAADRNRDGVVDAAEMYIDVRQPESTFTDRRRITLGGRNVDMIYSGPNHAFDLAVLHFPAERAVMVVDYITVKNRFPGGFDDGAPLPEWVKSIRLVENLDFDAIVPGHGEVGAKADVVAYRQYFEDLMSLVGSGIAANQTVEQLQASPALDKYKDWINFPMGKNQNIAEAYALRRAQVR